MDPIALECFLDSWIVIISPGSFWIKSSLISLWILHPFHCDNFIDVSEVFGLSLIGFVEGQLSLIGFPFVKEFLFAYGSEFFGSSLILIPSSHSLDLSGIWTRRFLSLPSPIKGYRVNWSFSLFASTFICRISFDFWDVQFGCFSLYFVFKEHSSKKILINTDF